MYIYIKVLFPIGISYTLFWIHMDINRRRCISRYRCRCEYYSQVTLPGVPYRQVLMGISRLQFAFLSNI